MKPTSDIIEMAREAGIDEPESDWMYWAAMERFAALVRADEREACEKACKQIGQHGIITQCVNAIRARGQT